MDNSGYEGVHRQQVVTVERPMGDWRYGLYDCFSNIGLCCLAFWVPCIVEGEIAEHFGENKMNICLWVACGGCNFLPTLRALYRQQHNIPGTMVGDYVYGFCCMVCLMVQLKREIDDPRQMVIGQATTTTTTTTYQPPIDRK